MCTGSGYRNKRKKSVCGIKGLGGFWMWVGRSAVVAALPVEIHGCKMSVCSIRTGERGGRRYNIIQIVHFMPVNPQGKMPSYIEIPAVDGGPSPGR